MSAWENKSRSAIASLTVLRGERTVLGKNVGTTPGYIFGK